MRPAALLCALTLLVSRGASGQESETEITVRAERAPGASGYQVPGELARQGAGTQGDPAKVVQSLPGVGRGGIGGGDLVLWGSEPRESRIEIDGVEVPLLYHGSGVRSVLPAGLVDNVRVEPGAFGPERGRAIGGLVALESRQLEDSALKLQASADLLDASVIGSSPIARVGAAGVAFRYGYVDRWLPPLMAPELRGLYRVPGYWDARVELAPRLTATQTLSLVMLASSDKSSSELLSQDPASRQRTEESAGFGRVYARYSSQVRGGSTTVTPFVGWDRSEQTLEIGQQSSGLKLSALRYGLRAEHRTTIVPQLGVAFGVDAAGSAARIQRRGALSVPRREGDPFPFGTPPGSRLAVDDYRAHILGVGVFMASELHPTRDLRVQPSLRFEPTLIEVNRTRPPIGTLPDQGASRLEAAVEPRIAVEQRLSSSVRLFGAAGRYHQPPDPADLSSGFGNPALGLASASHLQLGESTSLASRTRVDVSLFAKWLEGLPVRSSEVFARVGEVLVPEGRGRAFGTQLFVRQPEVHGFSGWLSATLSRSERRHEGGVWRLSDFDSPLALAFTGLQRVGAFRFGARARFASGNPRTPVTGAYYDVTTERYQPLLGPSSSTRLRDFFQLDLRVDRRFELGKATALEIYLEGLNVTARRNQEEVAYSSDFRRVGSIGGLPPLAMVGLTVER